MSSEIIVVLVMVVLAVGGLVYLERHSRRNKGREAEKSASEESD
jgi:flagellar basal body-associated protein FliL